MDLLKGLYFLALSALANFAAFTALADTLILLPALAAAQAAVVAPPVAKLAARINTLPASHLFPLIQSSALVKTSSTASKTATGIPLIKLGSDV